MLMLAIIDDILKALLHAEKYFITTIIIWSRVNNASTNLAPKKILSLAGNQFYRKGRLFIW